MEKRLLARYPIGNPRRLWRQDRFIRTVANPGPLGLDVEDDLSAEKARRGVRTCMEAGFDMLQTIWSSKRIGREILRTAESLGGAVIFQDLKRFGGMGHKNIFCESDDLLGVMREKKNWKSVAGYFMWDEPATDEQLMHTHRMIELCEQEQPDKLPYTVANPSYHPLFLWENGAYAPYIERFVSIVDPAQMDFDYYPIGMKECTEATQLDESLMWCDLETVRRAAGNREIPFWFYYQGHKYPFKHHADRFTFTMVRAMAHAGMLHGAKALSCYIEMEGVIDPETGGHGIYFEEQRRLNEEIGALGNTLMALTCLRVIHDGTLLKDCPYMEGLRTPMEESELLTGTLPSRVSVSEHTDTYGNRYLMVLNRDYERDSFVSLKLKNPSHVYRVSKADGEQSMVYQSAKGFIAELGPGDLALYRIQSAEEAPYLIEYYLEKETV
ncbi:MAG: hypothetical protein E7663_06765 [Ruminococcaceae bacterium]|nr:hypothetical protein [Oscillospiraceae bacterium]